MEKVYFNEFLKGNRIFLRKHSLELAEMMFNYVKKDEERLQRFLPWPEYIKTVKDEEDYINNCIKNWNEYKLFDYGIFLLEKEIYIGNIGVHNIIWANRVCELGYWIFGEYEGKGYMSESVKILEKEIFSRGFNRIEIRCASENLRSSIIPQYNNYNLDGVLRENTFLNNEYTDMHVFSKLKSEYES